MLLNRFLHLFPTAYMSIADDGGASYDDILADTDDEDDVEDDVEDTDDDDEESDEEEDDEPGSEEDDEDSEDDEEDSDSDSDDEEDSDSDSDDEEDPEDAPKFDPKDFVPKAEVSKLIQRRVNNLQKKLEASEESVKVIKTISSITGIPVSSLAGQLTEAAAKMIANQQNISVEQAKKQVDALVNEADQQKARDELKLDKEEIKILKDPKKYPGYDDYAEEIREIALDKGLTLAEAYILAMSDRKRVMENYKKETPVKKQAKNMKKKSSSGAKPSKPGKSEKLSPLERKALGDLTTDDLLMYADPSSSYDKVIAKSYKKKR